MRRTVAAAVVALSTGLSVLPLTSAGAADGARRPSMDTPARVGGTEDRAVKALDQATDILRGSKGAGQAGTARHGSVEGTLALRDLFVARDALSGADRSQADALLARPTDGAGDVYGDGYTAGSTKMCKKHFCVHYTTSTADAPPSGRWVRKTLNTMNKVWRLEVDRLGYRRPVSDARIPGNNGGNGKFDIYLKDVGANGLYGYCAPEYVLSNAPRVANGYCVLDDDFASSQFGGAKPANSLKVTAAHEFFHAIQFAYDYREDKWFMESTATWMEERFADKVNDNRQYLPVSQVAQPGIPLDAFASAGYQYGNWTWWEYLSSRYGRNVVQSVWNKAAAFRGAPNQYSTKALKNTLKSRGGFAKIFARYAGGNTVPARTYSEGRAYPSAAIAGSARLSRSRRAVDGTVKVNHLASANLRFSPDKTLKNRKWKLRLVVNGPGRGSSPGAVVTVRTKGGVMTKTVKLSKKGKGRIKVGFSKKKVRSVTVTLANASTRFTCGTDPNSPFSCEGYSKDDGKTFSVSAKVVK